MKNPVLKASLAALCVTATVSPVAIANVQAASPEPATVVVNGTAEEVAMTNALKELAALGFEETYGVHPSESDLDELMSYASFSELASIDELEEGEVVAQSKIFLFKMLVKGLRSSKADAVIDRIPRLTQGAKDALKEKRGRIAQALEPLDRLLSAEAKFKNKAKQVLSPIVGRTLAFIIVEGIMLFLF